MGWLSLGLSGPHSNRNRCGTPVGANARNAEDELEPDRSAGRSTVLSVLLDRTAAALR